jgi:hypothetical protein
MSPTPTCERGEAKTGRLPARRVIEIQPAPTLAKPEWIRVRLELSRGPASNRGRHRLTTASVMQLMTYAVAATPAASVLGVGSLLAHTATQGIDNNAIGQPECREHKAPYGLVFRLAEDVTGVLDAKIYPSLRERLPKLGRVAEPRKFNLNTCGFPRLRQREILGLRAFRAF